MIASAPLDLASILEEAQTDGRRTDAELVIALAEKLLDRSRKLQTPQERRQQAELDRMISHPGDKATLVEMTDQAFRTHSPARVADQLTHLLDLQGVPRFFSPLEQTMLRGFQTFGEYLPGVAVPLVKEKMRQETANVILPAEDETLRRHLRARQETGLLMNVNFLGEALLGEEEANRRLQHYLHALQMPEIACISVKLSTIYSQVSMISRRHTIDTVADRLEYLYRAACREVFTSPDGASTSKFVYLDMEEYRDLHLTAAAFMETLDRPGLEQARAGIALQAYVPDSDPVLVELLDWARRRVESGGQPITIRLVKGANMEMERVEASIGGWPQTPYTVKEDTDANFKRMLRRMVQAAADGYLRIGVASHNLFDVSLALLWASRHDGALDAMQFEMLEGMANHQRRALSEAAPQMLLYAPACTQDDFLHAIGYLIRRLDENTGEDNFLRHTFRLTPGSEAWDELADGFRRSLDRIDQVGDQPRRTQDRRRAPEQPAECDHWSRFDGEPDTDWSLPQNETWAQSIVADWSNRVDDAAETVPLHVGDEAREPEDGARELRDSVDPSRPKHVACRFVQASEGDVQDAITVAVQDPSGWRESSITARHAMMRRAAQLMRERRGDLIGAMMLDGGKLVTEADPEVSEAIDFAEFYPLTARETLDRCAAAGDRLAIDPLGVVAVISPWNFPLAIACGGMVAGLVTGNTVILKPASDTVLPAYKMAQCFWDAGVPRTAMQVIPCSGGGAGKLLVTDPRVDAVVLTGGTETAKTMLKMRPGVHLMAETGGKNATIVTALADRDLAIKNLLHSAFGHTGQKCSATSLLLLQQELYDDPDFRRLLADAARSLRVGPAWDLSSKVGPIIRPPSGDLEKGMKELETDEDWLVMPRRVGETDRLFQPGIKWNVHPDSFTHKTELFGPVLGVMPFGRLEEAIEMVNATGYGLTSGLESLDVREQALWRENIRAGNLYINRPTTGAIVLRQPFGGLGSSGYGPGAKAGGPHYVLPLLRITNPDAMAAATQPSADSLRFADDSPVRDALDALADLARGKTADSPSIPDVTVAPVSDWITTPTKGDGGDATHSTSDATSDQDAEATVWRLQRFAAEAESWRIETLMQPHDHFKLVGQDNLRRYLPVEQLRVRLRGDESFDALAVSMLAAATARCNVTYSLTPGATRLATWLANLVDTIAMKGLSGWHAEWLEESDAALAAEIVDRRVDRLRTFHDTSETPAILLDAAREAFITILGLPVVDNPEFESLRYLHEQSISHTYHRYGNLGRRAAGAAEPSGKL